MYFSRMSSAVGQLRSQYRMAARFGTRREFFLLPLEAAWERFWVCRVHGKHQEKMDSHGACYRCGKAMR